MHVQDQKHIPFNLGGIDIPTFKYEKFGICGVGKDRIPMVNMDQYIDHSQDLELHRECCIGLAKCDDYKSGMVYGALPPGNTKGWSEMLRNLEEHDPDGFHRESIKEIIDTTPKDQLMSTFYKYAYYSMGASIPWFFAFYIKKNSFGNKTQEEGSYYTPLAKFFPKLTTYIESLPFEHVGRILLFTTYPNAGVIAHRDSIVAEHKDHNINLFFKRGRLSYVWDEFTEQKIYLDRYARSYYFNNRDYHGVDPEPEFRYTVRVDGTFTKELQDTLGLEDGYTWKWDYKR